MLQDFLSWLLATFVIAPVQAEITSRLQAVEAPADIVQQVESCIVDGTSALVSRAAREPLWTITTSASVAFGLTDAQSVLAEASPECAAAVTAIKPFLTGPES